MRFRWFWDRIADRWILNDLAAVLFGAASVLVYLVTAYCMGIIAPDGGGFWKQLLWGTIGVLGPVSCIFLWGGMRRYQEMRGPDPLGDSPRVRFLMLIGLWWTAAIYYLVVYLPQRRNFEPFTSQSSESVEGSSVISFGKVVAFAWILFLVFISVLFAFPRQTVSFAHGKLKFLPILMAGLLLLTVIYKIIHFMRGQSRN